MQSDNTKRALLMLCAIAVTACESDSATLTESSNQPGILAAKIYANHTGFCKVDGTIDTEHSGATGEGYANTDNFSGAAIVWRVVAASAGNYPVDIRYANGSGDAREATLSSNSNSEVKFSFDETEDWSGWDSESGTLYLSAGVNEVALRADNTNGLPNIDYMDIDGTTAASCDVQSATTLLVLEENESGFCSVTGSVENEHTGFNGDGFANTRNNAGSRITYKVKVSESNNYTVLVRYANKNSSRRARLVVNRNQGSPGFYDFPSTGDWPNWSEESTEVVLPAGESELSLIADNSNGLPNIDHIVILGTGEVEPVDCSSGIVSETTPNTPTMIPVVRPVNVSPTVTELNPVDGTRTEYLVSHNFDNGEIYPFEPCTVQSPNYARVSNGRMKTRWTEDGYNGSRMTKGSEFCDAERGDGVELRTRKEGWMGFTVNIDPRHSRSSDSAIAQVFGFDRANSFWSWEGLLKLVDGDLGILHRTGKGSNQTYKTIVNNFQYGVDHDIVIGFVLSKRNNGMFKVWVNGELKYNANNINFGFGSFNSNDEQTGQTYTTYKLGQYNHSNDYRNGEERIIYYDNVTWYTRSNGYDIVAP